MAMDSFAFWRYNEAFAQSLKQSETPMLTLHGFNVSNYFNMVKLALLEKGLEFKVNTVCLLYTSPSPRDRQKSRMPSSA